MSIPPTESGGECKQEEIDEQGYLVECFDKGTTNHKKHESYISWINKETFELNYKPYIDVSTSESTTQTKNILKIKSGVLIEQEMQAKGKTAPSDIETIIRSEYYFTATDAIVGYTHPPEWQAAPSDLDRLMFCVLVLANGYVVTGEAACVSAENFDAEIGKSVARQNAIDKIWPLLGYALRTKIEG